MNLLPSDAESVARDIDFCIEAGDLVEARAQLERLIKLLADWPLHEERRTNAMSSAGPSNTSTAATATPTYTHITQN